MFNLNFFNSSLNNSKTNLNNQLTNIGIRTIVILKKLIHIFSMINHGMIMGDDSLIKTTIFCRDFFLI